MDTQIRTSYTSLSDFAPDWIIPPGETISDVLDERGWTQTDLAKRADFSTKHVYQLLRGEAPITQDTAAKLEKVLGSTARFWVGLDTQYREQLARRAELIELEKDIGWLKELPLADMKRFKWIKAVSTKVQLVLECLRFFAVSSVEAWRNTYANPVAAYRAAPKLKQVAPAVAAWLRQGERRAETMQCNDFDVAKFKSALITARGLTREGSVEKFLPLLMNICAKGGVAVVLEPTPKGCPINGATKWLAPNKALIMLSVRGKTDDKLWFTFFHEAGHLLKHGKSLTFLDVLDEAGLNEDEEAEADLFARDFLIPQKAYAEFVSSDGQFSATRVIAFAKSVGISPGIIVGRLQYDKRIPYENLNRLKARYVWSD